MAKNKLPTIIRMPVITKNPKKYCLICHKDISKSQGFICSATKHFKGFSDRVISFYNLIFERYGLVFAYESKKQIEYFNKDIQELYNKANKEINDDGGIK